MTPEEKAAVMRDADDASLEELEAAATIYDRLVAETKRSVQKATEIMEKMPKPILVYINDKLRLDYVEIKWMIDEYPDISWLEISVDKERIEQYHQGLWWMEGCQAIAVVSYALDTDRNRRLELFTSGGLWSIESDSDPKYRKEVEQEELEALKRHLQMFGVDTSDFESKVKENRR